MIHITDFDWSSNHSILLYKDLFVLCACLCPLVASMFQQGLDSDHNANHFGGFTVILFFFGPESSLLSFAGLHANSCGMPIEINNLIEVCVMLVVSQNA